MPQSDRTGLSYNIGNEFSLDLVVNNQVVNEFGLIDSIDRKVNATLLECTPTNNFGYTVRRVTYQGWSLGLNITRQDDTFDDFVDALVQAYHAHGQAVVLSGLETVINNGTASQWRYSGGAFVPDSLGNAKGSDKTDGVSAMIHFSKRDKRRGGSNAPNLLSGTGL